MRFDSSFVRRLFLAGFVVTGFLAGKKGVDILEIHGRVKENSSQLQRLHAGNPRFSTGEKGKDSYYEAQRKVEKASEKAGLSRLLGIRAVETKGFEGIQVEWEGSTKQGVRFLRQLEGEQMMGPCVQLHLNGSPSAASPSTRGAAIFRTTPVNGNSRSRPAPPGSLDLARDVFSPLWPTKPEGQTRAQADEIKRINKERRREEARTAEARREQEEKEKLESKRRQLETGLVLTGIVNNGQESLAFVDAAGARRGSWVLRQGDTVQEAQVTVIDEKKGEVRLDYAGKMEVSLRLSGAASGNARE